MNTHQFFNAYRRIAKITSSKAVIDTLFPGEFDSMKEHFVRKWDEVNGNFYMFYFMLDLPFQKKVQEVMENIVWGISTVSYTESTLPEYGAKVMISQDGEIWHKGYYTSYEPNNKKMHFGAVLEKSHLDCVTAHEFYFGYMRKPLDD